MLTKAINVGILLLAFSKPISMALKGATGEQFVENATAGLSRGKFNKAKAMEFYGPMLAAILLKKAVSMVRKTVRV